MTLSLIQFGLALLLAPLLQGIINRTKAIFAGRTGQPLCQLYFDLWRLLHKGAVYSRTTSWVFRTSPSVGLACMLLALVLMPLGGIHSLFAFSGDMVVMVYLLGLARFAMVLAALDTGSPFEGMGASREVQFSALAEPALFLALAAITLLMHTTTSLSALFVPMSAGVWREYGAVPALVACTLLIVFLAENARIPVDDPNTHLELTMIHEVMVLDHSGPDFAFILYSSALKLWVLGALLVNILLPVHTGTPALDLMIAIAGMFALAVVVGVIESTMARLRLVRVPQLLIGAAVLSGLALILMLR